LQTSRVKISHVADTAARHYIRMLIVFRTIASTNKSLSLQIL
jgi:hypothetical protein